MKQLIIRKRDDWTFISTDSIRWNGDQITLDVGAREGCFYLKVIDSGENGFTWGRVSLDCDLPEDSLIHTSAYASDHAAIHEASELDGLLQTAGGDRDFYLNVTGRYLWLRISLIALGVPPGISAIRIYMSGDHMIDYLPEIYRKGGTFTRRFLSVFDSVHSDMENAIYDLPARFDFESAGGDLLRTLADWVCIDAAELDDETTVSRIRSAFEDYEDMYTVSGVKRSVFRLCGREPIIIESADVDPNKPGRANSELYRKLYGENPYKFFILLEEDSFPSRAQAERFIKEMRGLIPASTEFELVLLKRCVQLDLHTYLGVNSSVGDYTAVVIDENSSINYDMTIGGNDLEGR